MIHRLSTGALAVILVSLSTRPCAGQGSPSPPGPTLGQLQAEATGRDPRTQQLNLLVVQSDLRLRDLAAERLPAIRTVAAATYQSDVVRIPFELPGNTALPIPSNDVYDAHVELRQSLHDPTRGRRQQVELARREQAQASVRTTLFELREQVGDVFFEILSLRAQQDVLAAGITEIEARLRVAEQRVAEGAALPSEVALLQAEAVRRRQSLAELIAQREASGLLLESLTGRADVPTDSLALPDLSSEVARVRQQAVDPRTRPEFAWFARSRELAERQAEVISARGDPRLSAFGRAGYGRPGLNPLNDAFDSYWLTGIQVEWAPWNWGTSRREREVIAAQREILTSDEAAFRERVRRQTILDLATIDRLAAAVREDEQIIALHEAIVAETRLRFAEGVITSAEFVDRETDLLQARLAMATRRVERAHAAARFLTHIGLDIP